MEWQPGPQQDPHKGRLADVPPLAESRRASEHKTPKIPTSATARKLPSDVPLLPSRDQSSEPAQRPAQRAPRPRLSKRRRDAESRFQGLRAVRLLCDCVPAPPLHAGHCTCSCAVASVRSAFWAKQVCQLLPGPPPAALHPGAAMATEMSMQQAALVS